MTYKKDLITLNRTLIVQTANSIEQVSAFVGCWRRNLREDGIEYIISEICSPKRMGIMPPIILQFKKTAIVATQELN